MSFKNSMCFLVLDEQEIPQIVRMYCNIKGCWITDCTKFLIKKLLD